MKDILGGKGANLAEMAGIGLPVPPGFTISTEVCTIFDESGNKIPEDIEKQIQSSLKKLETAAGQKFGDAKNPLLVSVRSGAKFSMPGMMDTILNLGLNDVTVEGLVAKSGQPAFRAGLLPPAHPYVRRRRPRGFQEEIRGDPERPRKKRSPSRRTTN